MKLWNLDVVFKVNGENLKERTLKKLLYCGLAVLNSPVYTYELFIIKMYRGNLKSIPRHFIASAEIEKYIQIR